MKKKETAPKTGLARLMELAGRRKSQLTGACIMSVLAPASRIGPLFLVAAGGVIN